MKIILITMLMVLVLHGIQTYDENDSGQVVYSKLNNKYQSILKNNLIKSLLAKRLNNELTRKDRDRNLMAIFKVKY